MSADAEKSDSSRIRELEEKVKSLESKLAELLGGAEAEIEKELSSVNPAERIKFTVTPAEVDEPIKLEEATDPFERRVLQEIMATKDSLRRISSQLSALTLKVDLLK